MTSTVVLGLHVVEAFFVPRMQVSHGLCFGARKAELRLAGDASGNNSGLCKWPHWLWPDPLLVL
jgi:hypothetical protein